MLARLTAHLCGFTALSTATAVAEESESRSESSRFHVLCFGSLFAGMTWIVRAGRERLTDGR